MWSTRFFASIGPLIPFLLGSWTGYSLGLLTYWKPAQKTMLTCAQRYPRNSGTQFALGRLDKRSSVSPKCQRDSSDRHGDSKNRLVERKTNALEDWIQQGGLGRWTWSVLAAQACRADIEELEWKQRERFVESQASANNACDIGDEGVIQFQEGNTRSLIYLLLGNFVQESILSKHVSCLNVFTNHADVN